MPLVTWLYLRGKCANCKTSISIRYFLVELLTGAHLFDLEDANEALDRLRAGRIRHSAVLRV
jgi:hypothetical protein